MAETTNVRRSGYQSPISETGYASETENSTVTPITTGSQRMASVGGML